MKPIYAFCGILLGFSATAHADGVPHWLVLNEKSAIEWSAVYNGQPVTGSFPAFTADIAFDEAHLDASHVSVKIDTGNVTSSDKDAQSSLPDADWLAAKQYPRATFEVNRFQAIPVNMDGTDTLNFIAEGTLTLRGKSVPLRLPFTLKFYDDNGAATPLHYVLMNGQTSVKRLDFGVGAGEWSATDVIPNEVKITVRLEAKQVP